MLERLFRGLTNGQQLEPKTLDEDLDNILDDLQDNDTNIPDYLAIVNSKKYADSNSNTKELEKLLSLVDIKNDEETAQEPDSKVSIESIICKDDDGVLPGQPCYQPAKFGKEGGRNFTLGKFDVPKRIIYAIKDNDVETLNLNEPMNADNYIRHFQTLLWIEESQQAMEMRRYDMYDAMLAKQEDFFVLEVPGLAEGRPSLMRGDRLILRSDRRQSYYEGYIYDVREKDILFKLHEHLHVTAMDGLKFQVQFLSSRTPFRRCHHGACQYRERRDVRSIVFPFPKKQDPTNDQLPLIVLNERLDETNLPTFNQRLNVYQKRAILNVMRAQSRPAPYIIYGPPGTGKTVTLVEAVLQIYVRQKDFKILVCASSNSSADICARRLKNSGVVKLDQDELLRVSAFYRMEKLIPPDLVSITKDLDMIDANLYEQSRIVVTTCIQSGCLYEFRDRFDFVFIDESGQSSEPESLIPIGLMARGGSIVLAGDPHQLGPVCVSHVAAQYGLGLSLLERLSRRSVYQRNRLVNNKFDYDLRYITKLRICYRCDARVLSISNKAFYDNDLEFVHQTPAKWLDLLRASHPLVFHAVKGCDRREYTNPSWFNPAESIRCLSYAKRLYDSGLRAEQLGIITPYRRQIEKMQLLFESCKLPMCKIATMEEFQGDEREVIIISTVRAREKRLDFDRKFQLGFLFNPKRFNVAVSRAKWMVIVVGDPHILARDPHWSNYMQVAHKFSDIIDDDYVGKLSPSTTAPTT